MAALSNYTQNNIIDALLRGVAFIAPSSIYVALFTVTPAAGGGGTEVTGGGYARQPLAPTASNWAATNAVGSSASTSTGTSGTTSNNVVVDFPSSTASWGTVVAFATFDAPTGGNMLFYGPVTPNQSIPSGITTPAFNAGTLTFSIA